MALIQFGVAVSKASGKHAGTVFSNNKGGSYIRRFSIPTNPNTVRQQDQRTILGTGASLWRLLGASQQAAWSAWAQTNPIINRLGAAVILTGSQAFTKIYSNLATYDPASLPLTTPPPSPVFTVPVADPTSITLATGGTVEFDAGVDRGINETYAVYASPPISPGRTFTKNLMRLIRVDPVAAPIVAGDTIDIAADYVAVFGFLSGQVGKKIVFDFYSISEGQVSVPQTAFGLVA